MRESLARLISVVIPAYNSASTLRLTLPSILRQNPSLVQDITVVDSSDDGGMQSIIEGFSPLGVRFITSGVRVMPGIQRNLGARATRGRLLLFLDADVIPEPDYVDKIAFRFSQGCRAGCGSVMPAAFQARRALPVAQYFIQLSEFMPRGQARGLPYFLGCSNFCERDLFEAAGGFPEIRASEDVLYGAEVRKFERIWFLPEAKVQHIFRERWRGFLANQRLLGKYVAVYRKMARESWICKGIAPYVLFPAFFAFKLLRILPRIVASGFTNVLSLTLVSPIFALGIASWCVGFVEGLRATVERPPRGLAGEGSSWASLPRSREARSVHPPSPRMSLEKED